MAQLLEISAPSPQIIVIIRPHFRAGRTVTYKITSQQIITVYLFEIKHTKNVSEGQTRLLDSKVFIDYIKKNFGCVKHSVVLYNGKNDISLTIPCLNIACFLSDIYSHSKSKSYSLDDTIKRLVKRAEKDINRSKN